MRLARGETTQGPDGRALLNELVRLRPFGEAYVMKNFGERLSHADAEDAVSDVTLRLHRQIAAGKFPDNLQAAFLTGARNAAIDRLRRRSRKPTVEIEAAADAAAELPPPEDLAERRESAARIHEVLLRVNPRQRRVLSLRFDKGMTVPEISADMGVSLAAAKNLLARGIAQARLHLEAIDGREVCPQMQGELREALDRELGGTESDELLRAHLEHCGTCKAFMRSMRRDLHQIGAPVALAAGGLDPTPLHHLGRLASQLGEAAHAGLDRAKLTAHRLGGLGADGSGASGALAGTGQKVAAICGAAATTTCLATGLVGPGVGTIATHQGTHPHPPSDHSSPTRRLSKLPPEPDPETSAEPVDTETTTSQEGAVEPTPTPAPPPEPEPGPSEAATEEFGFEASAPPPEPQPAPNPPSPAPATAGGERGQGGESFGFDG